MRSRDWYSALVGLWVRWSHDEEKMRADFSCAGISGAEIGSRCSYKVLLASDQSTFGSTYMTHKVSVRQCFSALLLSSPFGFLPCHHFYISAESENSMFRICNSPWS